MKKIYTLLLCLFTLNMLWAQAPIITSFAPTSGVVNTNVIITGTNFNAIPANNSVYFGAIKATPTAGNATSLTVAVPLGATSVTPIVVQDIITGLQASSLTSTIKQFNVTNTPTITPNYSLTSISTPATPSNIVITDFNNDGNHDIIAAYPTVDNVGIRLGNGTGAFGVETTFSVGKEPNQLSVADFNGDGKMDFVAVNRLSLTANYNVTVRLGNGVGSFGAAINYDLTPTSGQFAPYASVVGDIDKDGDMDIIVTNRGIDPPSGNSISILKNNGNGTFAASYTVGAGSMSFPNIPEIGDFNNDSKIDIAVPNLYASSITVLLGDGAGGFSGSSIAVGNYPADVKVADFNNDGNPDMVSSHIFGGGGVRLHLGDGTGGFSAPSTLYTSDCNTVSIADFNGDGQKDIAVPDYSATTVKVFLGTGTGTFGTPYGFNVGLNPVSIKTADFNKDKKVDLIFTTTTDLKVLLWSLPVPTITSFTPTSGGTGTNVTITGTNFNAIPANNSVYFGSIKVTPTAGNTTSLTVAVPAGATSVTPIVVQDISSGLQASSMETITGTTTRQFTVTSTLTLTPNYTRTDVTIEAIAYAVAIGDFNNDGYADWATAHRNGAGTVNVSLGDGIGGFSVPIIVNVGAAAPSSIATGDFNGDGNLDFATANATGSNVSIKLGDGAGGFSGATLIGVGSSPWSIATGDFNGDGNLDFATANSSNDVSIRLGDGTGNFLGTTTVLADLTAFSIAIGDFNGDGKSDFATANNTAANVSIRLGDGLGGFSGTTTLTSGSGHRSVAVGDFNGDGKQDLAVAAGNIIIHLGDGTGGFSAGTSFAAGALPFSVAVGDFNGDGKQDITTANLSGNNVSILIGDGAGGFSAPTNFAVGGVPRAVKVGDFNRDGRADLVVPNGANSASVLLFFSDAFITKWQTTTTNETITVPTTGAGYNCWVDWGDGSALQNFSGTAPAMSHVYTTANTYTVSITGAFPRIYFNNAGDKLKIKTIEQWGNIAWASMQAAFSGCSNLTYTATDNPNLAGVANMSYMFTDCSLFNGHIGTWNTSTVTSMNHLFFNGSAFNQPLIQVTGQWNTSAVTDMSNMFNGATAFNQSLASWQLKSGVGAVNMASMLNNCGMNTANYDATLAGWAGQAGVPTGVILGATGITYCASITERSVLISSKGWIITGDALQNISCLPTKPLGNRGLYFDGADDYVSTNLGASANVTLEGWIKVDDINRSHTFISNTPNVGSSGYALEYRNDGKLYFRVGADGGSGTAPTALLPSTTTIESNKWYHLAGTYDGATAKIFVNGIEENAVGTFHTINTTFNYSFGSLQPGVSYNMKGQLDEVRIFTAARTAAQIQTDMLTQTANSAAGYWNFDQSTGTSALDMAGTNHGTLQNGALWALRVTDNSDNAAAGLGSFRQAILEANTDSDKDDIDFSIQQNGTTSVILPTSEMTVTQPVLIDGYSAYGSAPNTAPFLSPNNAQLKVECSFQGLPGNSFPGSLFSGINLLNTTNSIIKGLSLYSISSAWGSQFNVIFSNTTNSVLEGSYIGLKADGSTPIVTSMLGVGIGQMSSANTIGGTTPSAFNVVGAVVFDAMQISGSNNIIVGNYVGTDKTGNNSSGGSGGLNINTSSGNQVLNNLISGNGGFGVLLQINANNSTIKGNYIGIKANLSGGLANGGNGVDIRTGTVNCVIGGTAVGEKNVIAYNGGRGVSIDGGSTNGHKISGNNIYGNAEGIVLSSGGNSGKSCAFYWFGECYAYFRHVRIWRCSGSFYGFSSNGRL